MKDLPAQLFSAQGIWFVTLAPLPKSPMDAVQRVVTLKGDDLTYIPVFTSEDGALRYANAVFGDEVVKYASYAFKLPNQTAAFLEMLSHGGCTHVAFDPDPNASVTVFPIREATNAVHRYIFGPGFTGN